MVFCKPLKYIIYEFILKYSATLIDSKGTLCFLTNDCSDILKFYSCIFSLFLFSSLYSISSDSLLSKNSATVGKCVYIARFKYLEQMVNIYPLCLDIWLLRHLMYEQSCQKLRCKCCNVVILCI